MACEQLHLVGALVDGELPAAQTEAVSRHVAACPDCSAEMDELRAMSRLVSAARNSNIGLMPDDAMARLRTHVQGLVESADIGLVWMARVFSGVAASVLIAGIWLLNQPVERPVTQASLVRDQVVITNAMAVLSRDPAPATAPSAPDVRSPESILDDLAGTNLSSAAHVTETELP
ncbi:anti-sigma factor family protein [Humisphaera borealis]|uniref:Zf-HC2 domain-containing protein n=1 Tax=Humisphaera borealis TaxID=2807512 RepID=A0A7M2WX85_9BACT|nr:zf-HC2 domain-containing protein [Humisphaera borealis]QOV89812.1 zf-HC2 domain-containing protein [Humisphaera borealis]